MLIAVDSLAKKLGFKREEALSIGETILVLLHSMTHVSYSLCIH